MYLRALKIYEKALSPDHPEVAQSLHVLAKFYGRDDRSASLYKRAIAIEEKALGRNHLKVAESLKTLAEFYYRQGVHAGYDEPKAQSQYAADPDAFKITNENYIAIRCSIVYTICIYITGQNHGYN